ncbi:protein FAR1-RELATED SEQUENCE 5-like [Rutidosis leptorrhynchoides]|uniref:protein FAR1-RELATED SEQUENCE 5-like n=1 Tax=Rutidosis leptorrhynchoides TaxID=125765 RepID=UPI003A98CE68
MNNIGSVTAYRLRACLNGGYDQVRGTAVDYKNHQRDVNVCIGERDAQMLIYRFSKRKLNDPEFCFHYKTEQDELVGLFWADETSRCNFREFGDVLAFDATYRTNRYNMVSVPFTGVDHHNKCVTFGGGLLKHETIDSYEWLLKAFLTAHPNQPQLVLTDQDPTMKEAITNVLTESTHRLCMWHVMKKLPKKVCGELLKNTDLRKRIHKLVWDVLLTKEKFESRWQYLISELNLEENTWLADKFKIRDRWVSGYISHLPICCLMKTTSRTESSNAFFRVFTDPDHTLVQFMLNFESAMDKQRHEHHVVTSDDVAEVYEIQDANMKTKVVSRHQVVLNRDGNIVCSCNHFGRHGWLCRHIFCVFNNKRIEEIPETYIKRRWRRDILPTHLLDKRHRYGMQNDETSKMCSQVISDVDVIVRYKSSNDN